MDSKRSELVTRNIDTDNVSDQGALLNLNFVLLWQGQLVSQVGSQAFLIAAMYWTMQSTGSASLMGALMMVSTLPAVMLGPIGGTLADWYSRRTIIVVADLLSGLCVLALAAAFFFGLGADGSLIVLFIVSVLLGVTKAFFQPAFTASIPDLVPQSRVAAANSLSSFSAPISTFVGQGLGGVLYRSLGPTLLFLLDGISYIFSAFSEAFIKMPPRKVRPKTRFPVVLRSFLRDTADGLSFVWRHPGMRLLLLTASLINFLLMPIFVLLPFYVDLVLLSGPEWYGFLLAALSAGAMIGFLAAGTIHLDGPLRARAIVLAFAAVSFTLAGIALVAKAWIATALFTAVGVFSGFINIQVITIFQLGAPKDLRGRVLSLVIALASGIAPLGMAVGGVLGDLTGKNIPLVYGICGGLAGTVALVAAANTDLRNFLSTNTLADQ